MVSTLPRDVVRSIDIKICQESKFIEIFKMIRELFFNVKSVAFHIKTVVPTLRQKKIRENCIKQLAPGVG